MSLLALAIGPSAAGVAATGPAGNNGTIKIHEQRTPSGTESNDPKVCVFNVEGYGFDVGQTGYIWFRVQGGDSPTGQDDGPHNFGPTQASAEHRSYYETRYFTLKPGHYKATLYGKKGDTINLKDVKAKSKVFKVRCEEGGQQPSSPPATTPPPSNPPSSAPPSSAPPSSAPPSTPTPTVAPTAGGETPTPTAAPTGGSGGETATPEPTLPPTDILAGSAQPSPEAWRLMLLAIAGLLAGILVLTPNRPRR